MASNPQKPIPPSKRAAVRRLAYRLAGEAAPARVVRVLVDVPPWRVWAAALRGDPVAYALARARDVGAIA